jgi:hypothetical protein
MTDRPQTASFSILGGIMRRFNNPSSTRPLAASDEKQGGDSDNA